MIEIKVAPDARVEAFPRALSVRQMPPRAKLLLRGRAANPLFAAVVEEMVGVPLPLQPNARAGTDPQLLWLSPTGWLMLGTQERLNEFVDKLRSRLDGRDGDVVDVGDEYTHLRVEGEVSADLLATCCPLDLAPRAFPSGSVARTLVAGAASIVYRTSDAAALDLYVDRSYAHYVLDALQAQMREFA